MPCRWASIENSGEVLDNGGFDPFRDLLANPGARPNDLEKVNLRALSPLQRALLAIDGTVTKFLEAYVLEPVEVIRLKQETVELASDHASLEAPHGTEVVARQVLLHGRYSGAYLPVGGGPHVWEEAIESLVNPRQSEMEQMIESHFAPAHTHPFEALLDRIFQKANGCSSLIFKGFFMKSEGILVATHNSLELIKIFTFL